MLNYTFSFGKILAIALSFFALSTIAQTTDCTSGVDFIRAGIDLHDEGKFEEALAAYESVLPSDTTYALALYERGLTSHELERYDEAIALYRQVLLQKDGNHNQALVNLGISWDFNGNLDSSLYYFSVAQERFPFDYNVYYNRGVTNLRNERSKDALQDFQRSVLLNPKHPASHLQLGYIAAATDNITQAVLSWNAFLMLAPGDSRSLRTLGEMENLFNGEFEFDYPVSFVLNAPGEDDFSELDLIVKNKIATSKKYKYKLKKLDLTVSRQTHLILNEFKNDADDQGFWMQTYGRLVEEMQNQEKIDDFLHAQVISVGLVEDYLMKKLNIIKDVLAWYGETITAVNDVKRFPTSMGVQERTLLFYENGRVGAAVSVKDAAAEGPAEYYYTTGTISSKGNFKNGERHGEWKYFHEGGILKEVIGFDNGVYSGAYKSYNTDGILTIDGGLSNGKLDGEVKYFNNLGFPTAVVSYKAGDMNGQRTGYYRNGVKSHSYNYVEGKEDGKLTAWHEEGALFQDGNFKNGELDGVCTWYYSNGKVERVANYKEGALDGEQVRYYFSGEVLSRGNYRDNNAVGLHEEYTPDGRLISKNTYSEDGKLTATIEFFDFDGVLVETQEVKKGEIQSYRQLNVDGSVIAEAKKRGGKFHYEDFNGIGTRRSAGDYEPASGNRVGVWKYYDGNGNIQSESTYRDGQLHGMLVRYHPNGQISEKTNYELGQSTGAFVAYYSDGALSQTGCFHEGQRTGEWLSYYEDGETIRQRWFYVNGQKHGEQVYYAPDATVRDVTEYDKGLLIRDVRVTLDGTFYSERTYRPGIESSTLEYADGSKSADVTYAYGLAEGEWVWYYPNGKIRSTGSYHDDKRHGEWVWYYPNGKIESKSFYEFGDLNGAQQSFFDNGQVKRSSFYVNGERHGKSLTYNETGKLTREANYVNGVLHGEYDFYSEDGALQMRRIYYHGQIERVGSPNADGKTFTFTKVEPGEQSFVTYFSNGKVAREFTLKNGLLHGTLKTYYSNGQLAYASTFNLGQEEGEWKEYFSDGKLKEESFYHNGEKHGEYVTYHSNGKVKSRSNLHYDVVDGDDMHYDRNGKLLAHLVYRNGQIYAQVK